MNFSGTNIKQTSNPEMCTFVISNETKLLASNVETT